MALVTIEANTIEDWRLAGAFELRVYSAQTWITEAGEIIPGTEIGGDLAYKRVACTYNGTTKVLSIPSIVLPATTDSQNNRASRYSVAGIYDAAGEKVFDLMSDFRVYHDWQPSISWGILRINNEARVIPNVEEYYYNVKQIHELLNTFTPGTGGGGNPTTPPVYPDIIDGGGPSTTDNEYEFIYDGGGPA